ncbi:MAG TPA: glycosyl hydrolase family 18 protein [Candidatus Limnocylindria bacterium]|nr:glycosyl hydrolase family 18 protein [Candidatus Limnocylindria bacterium]
MTRRARLTFVLLLAVACAMPVAGLAADPLPDGAVRTDDGRVLPPLPDELQQPSVHAEMLSDHADDTMRFKAGGAPSVLLGETAEPEMAGAAIEPMGTLSQLSAARLPNGLRKEVFGFLPYWMLTDDALASLNYQLVSTIAYFSVNANMEGNLVKGPTGSPTTGWAGWTSSRMTDVLNRAHANGTRVVLTVSMMAWDSASANRQAQLLGSSTARSRLVNQIVSAVRNRGADGVNLDFEPLATSLRDEYVSFVRQLKRALVNHGVGDYLTVCVMAGAATWATGYDVAGLTAAGAADRLFVMGYDFHWSGSSRAGGVAPMQSPYTLDVAGAMADFLNETSASKLIWGVPYYGRTWPTSSSALNATTLGGGSKSYTYIGHLAQAAQFGRRWDDVGKVPWYRYWDNAADHWVQGYYDDVASLGAKYDLINARGLAGTGMWTLLMDQGRDELWRLLANKFVNDTAPPVGGVQTMPATTDAEALLVRWRAQDYASGVSSYTVQFRRNQGAWRTWLAGSKKTSAWFAGEAGSTYEFRVRAVDLKGNAQSWVTVPGKPATVKAGAFARVSAATLNIRSGPGTTYGIVDGAVAGDVVYVLEGPVASGGYQWFRVQYGFTEWPSADFPRIAWMAGSQSGTAMLAPRQAPTVTRLSPFVNLTGHTGRFSPNGDGVQDAAQVQYSLREAASAVRLDVLNGDGAVVQSVALGPRAAGANSATWNGRLTGGAWAPAGSYLLRVTASDSAGTDHVGPAAGFSRAALSRWGVVADLVAPSAAGSPRRGAEMVSAKSGATITFSEPISGLSTATVQLQVGGVPVAANVTAGPAGRSATVTPQAPLPVNSTIRIWLSGLLRDQAGNPVSPSGWGFRTAPGTVYDPSRRGTLASGSQLGYAIAQDGDLRRLDRVVLAHARSFRVGQRATVPNLPGRWVLAETGPLTGMWLRESATAHLDGFVERTSHSAGVQLRLRSATHLGRRFTAAGGVRATRSWTVTATTSVMADARAIINGRPQWHIHGGRLDGYWLTESAVAFMPGSIERMGLPDAPSIDLSPGTHTGYRYSAQGGVTGSQTVHYGAARTVTVTAWKIVNGRAHFLVGSGALAGTWLPESSATRLHV